MFKAILEQPTGTMELVAKYDLDQEVYIPGHQSYRKGIVVGIAPNYSPKGFVMFYYVNISNRHSGMMKIRRYSERLLYSSVRDVLEAVAQNDIGMNDTLELY